MLQLNFSPFPQLTTERLVLRALTTADAGAIAALRSNEIVNQYLDRPKTTTPGDALLFIEKISKTLANKEGAYWVIALKENNALIGTICYWNLIPEENIAEIGYELHPDFHGKGIMQEAIEAVIDYGFNEMNVEIITAIPIAANTPSRKLLKRNNFTIDDSGKYAGEVYEGSENNVIYILKK
ncbi:GNAT family N-acetyltransferase [Ferruginibacter sp. SUN106]|uniref:GNAT family N-acetyltransferase n=1 Tax=Ferruginibacter sp. SUN106 TaxID=2978348 RepID=UPI003D367F2A